MKSTAAQTAAAIRTELKTAFPGIKFRVTSETYTGGSSVDIYFTDGVKSERIERIVEKYTMGVFNGMEDIYEMSNRRDDIPQVKYIFVNREMSAETRAAIAAEFGFTTDQLNEWDADARSYKSEIIYREFQRREFGQHAGQKSEIEIAIDAEQNGDETQVMGSFDENGNIVFNGADVTALSDAIGGDVEIKFNDSEIDAITDLFDTIGRGNARVIDVNDLPAGTINDIDPDDDGDFPNGLIGGNNETVADMSKQMIVWVNPKFRQ